MNHIVAVRCGSCMHRQSFILTMHADYTRRELHDLLSVAAACDNCDDTEWLPVAVTDSAPQDAVEALG